MTGAMTRAMRVGALVPAIATIGAMLAAVADAKDLPRGRGVPPARTGCESFGPDFHKVEGSETCIRISGSAQLQAVVRMGGKR